MGRTDRSAYLVIMPAPIDLTSRSLDDVAAAAAAATAEVPNLCPTARFVFCCVDRDDEPDGNQRKWRRTADIHAEQGRRQPDRELQCR